MIDTHTIAWERELCWHNPDPPFQQFRYPYYLRSDEQSWDELVDRLGELAPDRLLIVTDDHLPEELALLVQARLSRVAPSVVLTLPSHEEAKTLDTVSKLGLASLAAGATRASVIVALGGGLCGNVAGLLAGLFMRGVRLVHLPTTLLAMSDSCLSLKQGVNSALGKNHFGLFYPPVFVWTHLSFLETLPAVEIRSALCELIKNVLAIRPESFDEVAQVLRPDARYSQEQLAQFIAFCIDAKSSVMAEDALEKHEALVLEYGHTIGHALELASHGTIPHGIAVGIGMMVEARLSRQLGLLSISDLAAHRFLLECNGSPWHLPSQYATGDLLALLQKDNKRGYLPPVPGKYDLVLLSALGQPHRTAGTVLTQIDERDVRAAIDACRTV